MRKLAVLSYPGPTTLKGKGSLATRAGTCQWLPDRGMLTSPAKFTVQLYSAVGNNFCCVHSKLAWLPATASCISPATGRGTGLLLVHKAVRDIAFDKDIKEAEAYQSK